MQPWQSAYLRATRIALLLAIGSGASGSLAQYTSPQQPGPQFAPPSRTTAARTLLFVPPVIGSSVDTAIERLRPFRVERRDVPSVRAAGVVVDQEPRAPAQRAAGALVRIDVSDGSRVLVPPVRQRKLDDARARLTTNNLAASVVERESDDAPGMVAAQNPAEGTEVVRGSVVELIVSTGIAIPGVTGETLEEALRRLARFKVQFSEVESSELKGVVVAQDPRATARIASGARVVLEVSDGTRVAVPDLQSTTLAFARENLQEAGLAIVVRNWPAHADAIVKAQSPAARTVVRRGTAVELEVRPPTSWVVAAGAAMLLVAGYVGWLWKRPLVARTPASPTPSSVSTGTTTASVGAEFERGPPASASRVNGVESGGPVKPVDGRDSGRG